MATDDMPVKTSFIGREQVFSWINRHAHQNSPELPLILHGPPGIGKTTVTRRLTGRHFTPAGLVISIDMNSLPGNRLQDILWSLSKQLYTGVSSLVPGLEELEKRMILLHPKRVFWQEFWLPLLGAIKGKHLFVIWDDFDHFLYRIEKEALESEILEYLYRLRQAADNVNYLFTISSRPSTLQEKRFAPFELSLSYRLRGLRPEQTRLLLTDLISNQVYQPIATYIHKLTGGHPGDIGLIGRSLKERIEWFGFSQVTLADIAFVLDTVLSASEFQTLVYEMRDRLSRPTIDSNDQNWAD